MTAAALLSAPPREITLDLPDFETPTPDVIERYNCTLGWYRVLKQIIVNDVFPKVQQTFTRARRAGDKDTAHLLQHLVRSIDVLLRHPILDCCTPIGADGSDERGNRYTPVQLSAALACIRFLLHRDQANASALLDVASGHTPALSTDALTPDEITAESRTLRDLPDDLKDLDPYAFIDAIDCHFVHRTISETWNGLVGSRCETAIYFGRHLEALCLLRDMKFRKDFSVDFFRRFRDVSL